MTAQKTRRHATVQRILNAAAQVFAETGYEGARVDRIANRAGVNKAMIYYHIGDKKALYTRVLQKSFGDVASRMADALAHAATPQDKVRAYVRSLGQTLEQHPHLPPIMMRELASGGRYLPEVVMTDLVSIIGSISEAVEKGRQHGEFKSIDPFVMHLMVIGGLSYFKTSDPLRRRYATLISAKAGRLVQEDGIDLLQEIEKIVLGALTGG
jgi:AcrR family transcriptional regulator